MGCGRTVTTLTSGGGSGTGAAALRSLQAETATRTAPTRKEAGSVQRERPRPEETRAGAWPEDWGDGVTMGSLLRYAGRERHTFHDGKRPRITDPAGALDG